ncbi:MAG: N-acetylmuramoyl-L-alanine amidase [Proteobacteria bacterium]|nr:N-acetylmuramoyl-L-alanine amidase [Pseudomonadota bacterium]
MRALFRIGCVLLAAAGSGACDGGETSSGMSCDTDTDSDGDSDTDGDSDAGADGGADGGDADTDADAFTLFTPADGEHFYRLAPVLFSGHTPGPLEVFADGEWLLGSAPAAGEFSFSYAFSGTGARPITFVVGGDLALSITLTIDENLGSVCLDPGHPSSDGDKLWEAIINRKVGFYLEDLLRAAGWDVLLTTDDISEETIFADDFDNEGAEEQAMLVVSSLGSRTDACNAWPADYFISLHHNAVTDTVVNYTLTIYGEDTAYDPWFADAPDWAALTTDHLYDVMDVTGYQTWGDRSALGYGLYVLQNTDAIGILTEGSFYSNPEEYDLLNTDDSYLAGEAEAIFAAFDEFTAG